MKPKIMLRKKWANTTRKSPWIQFPLRMALWWTGSQQHGGLQETKGGSEGGSPACCGLWQPPHGVLEILWGIALPELHTRFLFAWWWDLELGTIDADQWRLAWCLTLLLNWSLMRAGTMPGLFPSVFPTLTLGLSGPSSIPYLLIWMQKDKRLPSFFPSQPPVKNCLEGLFVSMDLQGTHGELSKTLSFPIYLGLYKKVANYTQKLFQTFFLMQYRHVAILPAMESFFVVDFFIVISLGLCFLSRRIGAGTFCSYEWENILLIWMKWYVRSFTPLGFFLPKIL